MKTATTHSLDSTDHSRIGLASPQAIAAALPHMLGFHPHESLLTLWMQDGRLVVVQRADLTSEQDHALYLEAYLAAAANVPCDEATIVCVTRRTSDGVRLVRTLEERIPVIVRGAYIVSGGRVRTSGDAASWRWISAQDRQVAADTFGSHPDFRTVHRTRDDVVAEVDYDESSQWPVGRVATVDLSALCAVLSQRHLTGHKDQLALRDAVIQVPGRDLAIWWCGRASLDARRELLAALLAGLRATRPGEAAHLACAAAAAAWMCGDGVRANAALDRCLIEDPEHSMGRMLEAAIASALPPSELATMLADVAPEVVGATPTLVDSLSA